MVNIYLYRRINVDPIRYPNPYIFKLENCLSRYFTIANKNDNTIGTADLFRYLFRSKIFFLNWIEILPQVKYGKFQVIFFYIFLRASKGFGKKIVWTLHNKYSHAIEKNRWTDFMYNILMRYADLVLTHSESGIDYVKAKYPKFLFKTRYIMHPVGDMLPVLPAAEKRYDFLIWGGIHPYKGILEFLEFVDDSSDMKPFKILILGKCYDNEYKRLLYEHMGENRVYLDEYYELAEISKFASQSKFILFTYNLTSVLSSAALMDSIRMNVPVIGPNDGAFKDLSGYNFMYTYNSFADLLEIYKKHNDNKAYNSDANEFCHANTWEFFSEKLMFALKQVAIT